jgi:predicted DNA-binding helix-hairpin-helix protein
MNERIRQEKIKLPSVEDSIASKRKVVDSSNDPDMAAALIQIETLSLEIQKSIYEDIARERNLGMSSVEAADRFKILVRKGQKEKLAREAIEDVAIQKFDAISEAGKYKN